MSKSKFSVGDLVIFTEEAGRVSYFAGLKKGSAYRVRAQPLPSWLQINGHRSYVPSAAFTPAAAGARFAVHDTVVCVGPGLGNPELVAGSIHTITEAGSLPGSVCISGAPHFYHQRRFQLVPPAAPVSHASSKEGQVVVAADAAAPAVDPHVPGAKLDAGKLRPALVLGGFANALLAVTKVGTDGAAKYSDNGWKQVPNGFVRYAEAEARHRLRRESGEVTDDESGSLHLAHEAWNALAKLELYLRDTK